MINAIADDVAAVAAIDVVPKILEVVCRTTGMRFAAVARVTSDRWVACAVRDQIEFGLVPGSELQLETTICNEIRGSGQAVVIDHVSEDPDFRGHHTPAMYGFQSYISTPIHSGGVFFGTLCAIDPEPAKLRSTEALATFELFAALIGSHLDAQARLATSEAALINERETAELRDQFIAVLGHDLRNPIAAIDAGLRLLGKNPPAERVGWIMGQMDGSLRRMTGLIDNIMDFARGRLGGGFSIDRRLRGDLGGAIEQVAAELRAAHPHRTVETVIDLEAQVMCDAPRIAQILSNLLGNALKHGAPDTPVVVRVASTADRFEMSVANQGAAIPADTVERLFLPFSRAAVRPNQEGLGLGLYIAAGLAEAHGGTLTATSDETETRFTLSMPNKHA